MDLSDFMRSTPAISNWGDLFGCIPRGDDVHYIHMSVTDHWMLYYRVYIPHYMLVPVQCTGASRSPSFFRKRLSLPCRLNWDV